MRSITKRRLGFLAGFALYFGFLWFFWESPVVYPLKVFVVLLHEVSHAVAILATGGHVNRIVLDPGQGGATYGTGGMAFISLSAGYLGSLAWGAAMVTAARARRIRPELVNAVIGGTVLALTLLYLRSPFGIVFGLLFGTTLILASRQIPPVWNRRVLLTLGLTSCLYAVLDIKSDILDRPELPSDARMLAELTGVPTVVWGILWIVVALVTVGLLFRKAYREA